MRKSLISIVFALPLILGACTKKNTDEIVVGHFDALDVLRLNAGCQKRQQCNAE